MVKFYSAYNPPPTNPYKFPDCRFSDTLEQFTRSDGVKGVRVNGKFNLFDYVQSSKLMTDIYHLVDRYTNGDWTALNARPAQYGDVSGMPTNIHELYKGMEQAQRVFDGLDPDVKAYYGNDLTQFLANFENDLSNAPVPVEDVKGDVE